MVPLTHTHKTRLLVTGLFLALLILLVSACGTQPATPMEAPIPSPPTTPVAPEQPSALGPVGDGTNADNVAQAVDSRTPVPTPTPNLVDQKIEELAEAAGLTGKTFLGLTIDNWINIGISVLIVVIGYFISHKLIAELPKWITQHSSLEVREDTLKDIGANLVWLVTLFFVRLAVLRLEFLSDGLRTFLDDAFFVGDW